MLVAVFADKLIKLPQAAEMVLLKITLQVIFVPDYEKEFGHTELVTV